MHDAWLVNGIPLQGVYLVGIDEGSTSDAEEWAAAPDSRFARPTPMGKEFADALGFGCGSSGDAYRDRVAQQCNGLGAHSAGNSSVDGVLDLLNEVIGDG